MGEFKAPQKFANKNRKFFIVSALANHAVVHVLNGAAHNEAQITVWSKDTHGHQDNLQWTLASAPDGGYWIQSAINPNFVIHQLGANSDNAGAITLWDRTTHGHQGNCRVNFHDRGNGYYSIEFVHSGKNVHVFGATTHDNTAINQWDWVDQDNLKWKFQAVDKKPKRDYKKPKKLAKTHKSFYLQSKLAPHAVAHVLGGAAHNEAQVTLWSKDTHGHQDNLKWKISEAGNGHYYIESVVDTNFVIHQLGANNENNGAITLWDKRTHGHQGNCQVKLNKLGDGWYNITFVHSGKGLHVLGATTHDNTAISQWDTVDQDNLKWRFIKAYH